MQASNHSRAAALHNLPVEQLSTEDLEQLLRAQDQQDPDVELICKIMEVIQEREADQPQPDVDAAWQSFREEYQGQVECYQADANIIATEKGNIQHGQKHRRVLRLLATGLAAVLLLCGTAFASGIDLFQVIANWTNETFRFVIQKDQDITQVLEYGPFEKLYEAVSEYTSTPVVPTWAPDGTEAQNITITNRTDGTRIFSKYCVNQKEFSIYILIYDTIPDFDIMSYQKDGSEITKYELNGITHYFMNNNQTCSAVWMVGNIQCQIQGTLTTVDLLSMIESIYKE